jgi:nitrate reductase gamma subunit
MPCHAATFSAGDAPTIVALLIFSFGFVLAFSYILTGSVAERPSAGSFHKLLILVGHGIRTVFSKKIIPILKATFLDVLVQRRLFRQSPRRWGIHSLIFFPILFRFLWGIAALTASLWMPGWQTVWILLDKNHPATAFLFDLTGLMIIVGVVWAGIREKHIQSQRPPGLPEQDRWALGLVAGIVIVGFALEGMRIAMTEQPPGSGFAFIGHAISRLFSGRSSLTQWYGYMWYSHAVLTGALVAYVPFSGLLHIILAPVVLAIRAVNAQRETS